MGILLGVQSKSIVRVPRERKVINEESNTRQDISELKKHSTSPE